MNVAVSDVGNVLARIVYSNPLKAVSYYVRERGGKEATVFQLISSSAEQNYWGEYYFGKTYIEPPGWTGLKRQLFSFGAHDIDEYKKAYGLKDFDFYVNYQTTGDDALKVKKVADIKRGGSIIAVIYSSRPLPYEVVDADLADKMWDKKYANLKNLLQNNWSGLAVLRGYHHRID